MVYAQAYEWSSLLCEVCGSTQPGQIRFPAVT
jgi:hypothetical protein